MRVRNILQPPDIVTIKTVVYIFLNSFVHHPYWHMGRGVYYGVVNTILKYLNVDERKHSKIYA